MNKFEENDAMWKAVEHNDTGLMNAALESGCNIHQAIPNSQNNTPLTRAAEQGHDDVLRLLLESGVEVDAADSAGRTALHFAAMNGQGGFTLEGHSYGRSHLQCVNSLLSHGANVSIEDNNGRTALMIASLCELR